jgi:hypothetical protein
MSNIKEAHIVIHQLRTAVNLSKKLKDLKRELASYDHEELDQLLDQLDDRRQEFMATGEDEMGNTLDSLITHLRLGLTDDEPHVVPKRF